MTQKDTNHPSYEIHTNYHEKQDTSFFKYRVCQRAIKAEEQKSLGLGGGGEVEILDGVVRENLTGQVTSLYTFLYFPEFTTMCACKLPF